jgi:hypothetical protein
MSGSPAYWISPRGAILKSDITHIQAVLSNPEKFGYDMGYIRNVYDHYGEKFGIEGKAREEIITDLIRKGWIRMRRYPNRFWSVNVSKFSGRIRDNIWDAFVQLTDKGIHGFKEVDLEMPVNISELQGNVSQVTKKFVVSDIIGSAFFMESVEPIQYKVYESTFEDLPDLYIPRNPKVSVSMRPMDFFDRKILGESSLSGGVAYPGSARRNTYRVGDVVRFKLRDERLEGIVEVPFASDGKMLVVLGETDDPEAERVSVDPDVVELITRVTKKDVVKK